jgi:predicted 3-demethylubiquinone-9 3-methyltransferase (glyoxalase superfamily)
MQPITPCIWFDTQAEEAATFYTSVFPKSKITEISHYTVDGPRSDTVLTVEFELNGRPFTALNGGPDFKPTEAISFQVYCEDQEEVDNYWDTLSRGGEEGPCGWVKDRFGVSWQIVPVAMMKLILDPDRERARRATAAMMGMKKLDIAALEKAAAG